MAQQSYQDAINEFIRRRNRESGFRSTPGTEKAAEEFMEQNRQRGADLRTKTLFSEEEMGYGRSPNQQQPKSAPFREKPQQRTFDAEFKKPEAQARAAKAASERFKAWDKTVPPRKPTGIERLADMETKAGRFLKMGAKYLPAAGAAVGTYQQAVATPQELEQQGGGFDNSTLAGELGNRATMVANAMIPGSQFLARDGNFLRTAGEAVGYLAARAAGADPLAEQQRAYQRDRQAMQERYAQEIGALRNQNAFTHSQEQANAFAAERNALDDRQFDERYRGQTPGHRRSAVEQATRFGNAAAGLPRTYGLPGQHTSQAFLIRRPDGTALATNSVNDLNAAAQAGFNIQQASPHETDAQVRARRPDLYGPGTELDRFGHSTELTKRYERAAAAFAENNALREQIEDGRRPPQSPESKAAELENRAQKLMRDMPRGKPGDAQRREDAKKEADLLLEQARKIRTEETEMMKHNTLSAFQRQQTADSQRDHNLRVAEANANQSNKNREFEQEERRFNADIDNAERDYLLKVREYNAGRRDAGFKQELDTAKYKMDGMKMAHDMAESLRTSRDTNVNNALKLYEKSGIKPEEITAVFTQGKDIINKVSNGHFPMDPAQWDRKHIDLLASIADSYKKQQNAYDDAFWSFLFSDKPSIESAVMRVFGGK